MGDEFLSGTGFSLDKDRRICRSNLLHLSEDRFQSSATTDDPLEGSLDLIRHRVRDCRTLSHRDLYTQGSPRNCDNASFLHTQSRTNSFEQQLMIERLCKELDCTASHGLNPHPGVSMSGNKDDGKVAFLVFQPGLQLQTRHLRHADVNDQTRTLTMKIDFEKLLRVPD